MEEKTSLTERSQDELLGLLDGKLHDELFAFAPIERLHVTHESLVGRLRDLRQSRRGGVPAETAQDLATPDADATQPMPEGPLAPEPAPDDKATPAQPGTPQEGGEPHE